MGKLMHLLLATGYAPGIKRTMRNFGKSEPRIFQVWEKWLKECEAISHSTRYVVRSDVCCKETERGLCSALKHYNGHSLLCIQLLKELVQKFIYKFISINNPKQFQRVFWFVSCSVQMTTTVGQQIQIPFSFSLQTLINIIVSLLFSVSEYFLMSLYLFNLKHCVLLLFL